MPSSTHEEGSGTLAIPATSPEIWMDRVPDTPSREAGTVMFLVAITETFLSSLPRISIVGQQKSTIELGSKTLMIASAYEEPPSCARVLRLTEYLTSNG